MTPLLSARSTKHCATHARANLVPTTYFASTHTMLQTPRRHYVDAPADMASRELVTVLSSRNGEITPSHLAVQDGHLCADRNGPECARDCGLPGRVPGPGAFEGINDPMSHGRGRRDVHRRADHSGGYNQSRPGNEANLNMQYTQAMAYPTRHIFYSRLLAIPGSNEPAPGDLFPECLNHVISEPNVPQTICIP